MTWFIWLHKPLGKWYIHVINFESNTNNFVISILLLIFGKYSLIVFFKTKIQTSNFFPFLYSFYFHQSLNVFFETSKILLSPSQLLKHGFKNSLTNCSNTKWNRAMVCQDFGRICFRIIILWWLSFFSHETGEWKLEFQFFLFFVKKGESSQQHWREWAKLSSLTYDYKAYIPFPSTIQNRPPHISKSNFLQGKLICFAKTKWSEKLPWNKTLIPILVASQMN